jgi:4-amino-4-deoxy-L-arabinose transferase-like glycosyltransferase
MIKKKYIYNYFILFLSLHLIVWTIVPSITNLNLPLDTIEALAWGSNLEWGFNKHPPLSAFAAQIFYQIFGNQDWAYYFLSQLFVITAFWFVWTLSKKIFKDQFYSLLSVFLLEGIYFYNFTTPEFNVNICQLPFWAMTCYYFWQSLEEDKIKNWILLGVFAGFGFLSKYLFIYLLISMAILTIYYAITKKNFSRKYFISTIFFIILITPHLIWLKDNNYITVTYALNRTGLDSSDLLSHLFLPIIFLGKQIGIITPFLFMVYLLIKKFKTKIKLGDKKLLFLLSITILPIILITATSLLAGIKIRTMWMTPFYLYFGTLFLYLFKSQINLKKIKKFYIMFCLLFFLSPVVYSYVSVTNKYKRTDYPGNEIAYLVQKKWDKNFTNQISIIVGDEWYGGNLSYHLNSRPKWFNRIKNLDKINLEGGVIYTGNPTILKKVCPGVYGTIKPIGICMIGVR